MRILLSETEHDYNTISLMINTHGFNTKPDSTDCNVEIYTIETDDIFKQLKVDWNYMELSYVEIVLAKLK